MLEGRREERPFEDITHAVTLSDGQNVSDIVKEPGSPGKSAAGWVERI